MSGLFRNLRLSSKLSVKKQAELLFFSNPPSSLADVDPHELYLGNDKINVSSWRDVLRETCKYVYSYKRDCIKHRLMDPDFMWIDRRKNGMRAPFKIDNSLWIDMHGSADLIFSRVSKILYHCGVLYYDSRIACIAEKKQHAERGEEISTEKNKKLIDAWQVKSDGKIGRFVRISLEYLLSNHLIGAEEMAKLMSSEQASSVLKIYIKKCPLLSETEFYDAGGYLRSWKEPILVDGVKLFANKEWYEEYRPRYMKWLLPHLKDISEKKEEHVLIKKWETESGGKIGKFAWQALSYVLENLKLTHDEFQQLTTAEGVRAHLGFSLGKDMPLFALKEIVDANGYRRSWTQTINVSGVAIYVNQQWYQDNKVKLVDWLLPILNRDGEYSDMLTDPGSSKVLNDEDSDDFSKRLDAWGEENL